MMKRIKLSAVGISVSFFLSILGFADAETPLVQVRTYGKHVGKNIVYHYEVTNKAKNSIGKIVVGHRYDERDYFATQQPKDMDTIINELQLVVPPLGFDPIDQKIPLESNTSPVGWKGRIGLREMTDRLAFIWEAEGPPGLSAGQTLTGFSITVPEGDAAYLTGYFNATFFWSQAPVRIVTAPMELLDATPPSFTVAVTPNTLWPPDQNLVNVVANITVKDDYDPNPEIKLESITANETLDPAKDIQGAQFGKDDRQFSLKAQREGKNKAGRIYTITYSATDASGNKATASTTVTVPHDQRK